MFFSLLTFASAFLIEGLGTWISIIGLSSLFSSNPVIIALAAALDVGKVVTVSFLYKQWTTAPVMLRIYMILATAVLMLITSAGAFGYLSAAFQGAIKDTKQQQILVAAAKEEKANLEARKKEIDAQIGNLPANNVRGRQKLISAFRAESDRVNRRLEQLNAQLPKMQVEQITINTHAGPIVFVSQAFHVSMEQAVKYVILTIIFVFDPLAIALLIAGNFLWGVHLQSLRASSPATPPSEKVRRQESVDKGVEALPAAPSTAWADAVSEPIPRAEAREDSGALQAAGVVQSPAQTSESEPPDRQARAHPVEPAGPAQEVEGLADVKMAEIAATVDQPRPQTPPEQAIREAAYYFAEKRQFKDGTPADDWVLAEQALKSGAPLQAADRAPA
ncbi:MAG: DUF2934 domain-containing protein [Candidatus Accumulibacter phosphatis]|jgi:hypothetical protein|uniref:DUF2934 domain-containing protein n=2 Tax=Candidatus Accumulibacter TaxID=327159 RepID=A0A080LWT2_9PROT|nr:MULTISPECIES: DUF2934 domain-containing protein [Candidatus Accumulibacter]KFB73252.1 MAG: hypothetical protein AW09_001512 [Candidatus Accumulibacter phosphatis]NMQ07213.1 DUF2934 domain-containing protein [Candidatus Accumulibacter contiguus]HRF12602.1 DUF2934 domain-containing protein [Candidatus Accumulibacter phosphatis]